MKARESIHLFFPHSQPGTISSLMPYPNEAKALQNMHDGGRADTYVRFDGHWDELPKIIGIELNKQVLCTAGACE